MISDAKEARKAFERQKKKAQYLKHEQSGTVDPADIQVKQGLEIPIDTYEGPLLLPSVEQSSKKKEHTSLSKRTSIRTTIK